MRKERSLWLFVVFLLPGLAIAGYTDNGNGTVADTVTSLMWQKQDDATARTWEAALTYCEGLSLGSHTDWRLPNNKELKSLADMTLSNPSIDPVFTGTQSGTYWSSTTSVNYPTAAWSVTFDYGRVGYYDKTYSAFVRCVR